MMYLSYVNNSHSSDYVIAVELDDNFLNYIKEVRDKILATKLDIAVVQLNFDTTKARLVESGFYPYEDRKIHIIKNGEDPLDHYGYHISKHYFPKQEYWDEIKPNVVYLEMHGNSFGFSFIVKNEKYKGMTINFSDWEKN